MKKFESLELIYEIKLNVIHISSLKQASSHGLVLKKVHKVIIFNQNTSSKPYIDKNTDLTKIPKKWFWKDFLKLMNNGVFGKIMENMYT